MPVAVDVPIRLRVDPQALHDGEALAEALRAAAGRALASSRHEVVDPRGGYVALDLADLDVRWTGDGLAAVSDGMRAHARDLIGEALAVAAAEAGLVSAGGRAPVAVDRAPGERRDDDRFDPLLRLYRIPSFGGDEEAAVAVDSDAPVVEGPQTEWRWYWVPIRTDAEFIEAAEMEFDLAGYDHDTFTGLLGFIFRKADGSMQVSLFSFEPGQPEVLAGALHLTGLRRLGVQGEGRDAKFALEPVALPPRGSYRLRYFAPGGDDDQKLAALEQAFGSDVRRVIRSRAQVLRNVTRAEIEQRLDEIVGQALTTMLGTLPPDPVTFLHLEVDGTTHVIHTRSDVLPDLDVRLLPLVHYGEVTVAGDGDEAAPGEETGATGEPAGDGEDGDGDGDGKGRAAPRYGVFVGDRPPGETTGRQGAIFPPSAYTSRGSQDCGAFLGEPALDDLGEDGARLRRLVEEIAARLQIPPCGHAARFCINAARAVEARAATVGAYAVGNASFTRTVETGNLGVLQFAPTASPAIQLMRHLAGTFPIITQLSWGLGSVYGRHADKISGTWHNRYQSWRLRFLGELRDASDESVGWLFVATCRTLMLQLLRQSREAIDARLRAFDVYAPFFERMVRYRLAGLMELLMMRSRLQSATQSVGEQLVSGAIGTWKSAKDGLTEALGGRKAPAAATSGAAGEIVREDDRVVGMRDLGGRLWTMADLETAIAIQRGVAEEIDPLVKQIADEDEMGRFRANPDGIRDALRGLLNEMAAKNQEITAKVEGSWTYAFEASKIREDIPRATIPGGRYAMGGIHLMAHQQIGEFFRGDHAYHLGVNSLFGAELGKEKLTAFFTFTGLVFLAVVCAPAAFLAGVGVAAHDYAKAQERKDVFRSLIDPELVASRAEIEAELFAAELGLVLSFIPEAGTIAKGGLVLGRTVARHGVRRGARVAGGLARRQARAAMRERLKHGALVAFAKEAATDQMADAVLGKVLEPIIQQLEREITVTGTVGGVAGAQRVLQRLAAERRAGKGGSDG